MNAKGWTLYVLDFAVMIAFIAMVGAALLSDQVPLPPWQATAAVGATAGFVAVGVRDFWPDPRPAAATQEETA